MDVHFADFVRGGDLVLKLARIEADVRYGANLLSCLTLSTTRYRRLGLGLVVVNNFSPLKLFLWACGGSLEAIHPIGRLFGEYQTYLPFSLH